jgi:hypothetical protein
MIEEGLMDLDELRINIGLMMDERWMNDGLMMDE